MGVEAKLTWAQALAWRMRRQYLVERAPRGAVVDVVSRLCGAHAQLQSSAELTLWARVDGLEPGDVSPALWEERVLVKLWAMRGTLHLLPSAEYGLWQAALSTTRNYERPSWSRYFGVSQEELATLLETLPRALEERLLSRDELAGAVADLAGSEALGDKLRESWGAVLKPASYRGLLCFGPSDGRNTRFTLPRTWLPPWEPWEPQDAMLEIARRYLGAYAPATREDLARWWAGISPAQAGKLFKALGDELVQVDVEGEERVMLAEHAAEAAVLEPGEPGEVVRLLPAFDQWVVTAPREHDAFLAAEYRGRVYRPQAWFSPVLLVNGRMEGIWSSEGSGQRLQVTVEPFRPLPASVQQAAEAEAERLSTFLRARASQPVEDDAS
ncbi:MAG TPA: winged helix DNA-binding domain-containing protein [Anaerolineae bacterium]|nr:winged helix DNA-binding domain-containing protein [Anaerolineae bacterium]